MIFSIFTGSNCKKIVIKKQNNSTKKIVIKKQNKSTKKIVIKKQNMPTIQVIKPKQITEIKIFARKPIETKVTVCQNEWFSSQQNQPLSQDIFLKPHDWTRAQNHHGEEIFVVNHNLDFPFPLNETLAWQFELGNQSKFELWKWAKQLEHSRLGEHSLILLGSEYNRVLPERPDERESWLDKEILVRSTFQGTCHWVEFLIP